MLWGGLWGQGALPGPCWLPFLSPVLLVRNRNTNNLLDLQEGDKRSFN